MGLSIVITSGKGGTGKTSVTAGVGSCLAALGHKTLLIDADIGVRSLDLILGLAERSLFDWSDVLAGRVPAGEALISHPDIPSLYLLPAPANLSVHETDAAAFRSLVRSYCESFAYVLVDCPAGLDSGFMLACGACEEALVVTSTDSLAVRQAGLAGAALRDRFGMTRISLIVNRVRPRLVRLRHSSNIDDVMDQASLPLIGLVPEDELVIAAGNMGHPVILATRSGAAMSFLNIARRLTGEKVPLAHIKQWKVE